VTLHPFHFRRPTGIVLRAVGRAWFLASRSASVAERTSQVLKRPSVSQIPASAKLGAPPQDQRQQPGRPPASGVTLFAASIDAKAGARSAEPLAHTTLALNAFTPRSRPNGRNTSTLLPLAKLPYVVEGSKLLTDWGSGIWMHARLKKGGGPVESEAEMRALAARLRSDWPKQIWKDDGHAGEPAGDQTTRNHAADREPGTAVLVGGLREFGNAATGARRGARS
jgi:hypothetical protein